MKYIYLLLTTLLATSAFASEFEETLELAGKGDVDAQYNIGFMYKNGRGVPQNYREAVKWYRKAADQGYADAQYNLGLMHLMGYGVPENATLAFKWYRKAADQGYANAQYNIGYMYANGYGVPENFIKGYSWLSMAKTQGEEIAAGVIDTLSAAMTPKQIATGQALATKCYESNYKDCD